MLVHFYLHIIVETSLIGQSVRCVEVPPYLSVVLIGGAMIRTTTRRYYYNSIMHTTYALILPYT